MAFSLILMKLVFKIEHFLNCEIIAFLKKKIDEFIDFFIIF